MEEFPSSTRGNLKGVVYVNAVVLYCFLKIYIYIINMRWSLFLESRFLSTVPLIGGWVWFEG